MKPYMQNFEKIEKLNVCNNSRLRHLFLKYISESYHQNSAKFDIRILFDMDSLDVKQDILDKITTAFSLFSIKPEFENPALKKILLIFLHGSIHVFPTQQIWEDEFITKTPQEKWLIIHEITTNTCIDFQKILVHEFFIMDNNLN